MTERLSPIQQIRSLLQHGSAANVSACWQQFDQLAQDYGHRFVTLMSPQDEALLSEGATLEQLLRRTIEARRGLHAPVGVPTPAAAVRRMHEAGLMRKEFWSRTIHASLVNIVYAREQHRAAEATRLMHETLASWNTFLHTCLSHSQRANLEPLNLDDWSVLPSLEALERIKTLPKSFGLRLFHFWPEIKDVRFDKDVPTAALVTYNLLTTPHIQPGEIDASKGIELRNFLAHLLIDADTEPSSLRKNLGQRNYPKVFADTLLVDLKSPSSKAMQVLSNGPVGVESSPPLLEGKPSESVFHHGLKRAMLEHDLRRAILLWEKAQAWYSAQDGNSTHHSTSDAEGNRNLDGTTQPSSQRTQISRTGVPASLYDLCVATFMSLRSPELAIKVWNQMFKDGLEPTEATWYAMLEGCRSTRGLRMSNEIWQKMMAAGVQPDLSCWMARIRMLASARKHGTALEALNAMGRAWLEAVSRRRRGKSSEQASVPLATLSDVDGVAKPTVRIVNHVLKALLADQRNEDVRRLLKWIQTFGITPNDYTFNMLIGHAVRQGDVPSALQILQQMEALGITPDTVTFAIMLDGFFGASLSGDMAEEEKQSLVRRTLEEMESLGIKNNETSYGTLIQALLTQHSNLTAAQVVLDHMRSKKIEPNPRIYTMILHHYFARPTPDLDAIDTLCGKIRGEEGRLDIIVFDCIVQGFARLGDVHRTMTYLRPMHRRGFRPGWRTLAVVVDALIAQSDWERAAEIIVDFGLDNGRARVATDAQDAKRHFWNLVADLQRRGLQLPAPDPTRGHGRTGGGNSVAAS